MLTCCTHLRRPVFLDARAAAATLDAIRVMCREQSFANLAYCLMPDHAHVLVQGRAADSDFIRMTSQLKQRSAFACRAISGTGKLWQDGFHDRVARQDEDLRAMARYIIENPVRAGLTSHPSAYAYVGSDEWTIDAIMESAIWRP
jgi:REP element-mobilizing transposase RayT